MFRVVTADLHELHEALETLTDRGALVRAVWPPPSQLLHVASLDPAGHSAPLDYIRGVADASRSVNGPMRLEVIRQWVIEARRLHPNNGRDVTELAVMAEQLDWDLVNLGLDQEARARRLDVWDQLDSAVSAVDDAQTETVVEILQTHRHRGAAVIANKLGRPNEAMSNGAKAIVDLRRIWDRSPRYVPPPLATDVMLQSVLAYAGFWTKSAERHLRASQPSNNLSAVLRAALLWGWQAIAWLDAVITVEHELPRTRWAGTGRLAIPTWQLMPRSIATRGMVTAKLALLAGLVTTTDLDKARGQLADVGLEPNFDRPPGLSKGLDRYNPGDVVNLLGSSAPRQVLQEMLECPVTAGQRGVLLQTALLVRTVIGDGEDMPALVLPGEEAAAHPVLGAIPVLWRPSGQLIRSFQPPLTEYAEALDTLSKEGQIWNIGWLKDLSPKGLLLSGLRRSHNHPELAYAITDMLCRQDPAAAVITPLT